MYTFWDTFCNVLRRWLGLPEIEVQTHVIDLGLQAYYAYGEEIDLCNTEAARRIAHKRNSVQVQIQPEQEGAKVPNPQNTRPEIRPTSDRASREKEFAAIRAQHAAAKRKHQMESIIEAESVLTRQQEQSISGVRPHKSPRRYGQRRR